uniref:t-SNARE coiled-coil homology domain-containing protein n=1 Tax=Zooxanthella nutricula TaxID=1333877 RepID=A0A7S2MRE5_9DINO
MLPSAADPYYVAKEEIEATIVRVQEMHREWKQLFQRENTARHQRFQHLHAEICGDLRQLDFDLQDISETIRLVEVNRARFQMDDAEIASRKGFANKGRATVKEIQDSVTGTATQAKLEADKRQVLTSRDGGVSSSRQNQVSRDNDAFLDRERQHQQQIVKQQDETLDQIASSASRLQGAAASISQELTDQRKMLEDLDNDIDKETAKLNFVMKRMGRLLETGDSKQLCLIIGLLVLMVFLIFLIVNS